VENALLHLVEEANSGRAGSEAVLAKMSEALFVDTLRRYFAGLREEEVGWLAAARDPIIGKSLMLLHSRTAHLWTIAELATEVGSSRSAFVERPPAQQLPPRMEPVGSVTENTTRTFSPIYREPSDRGAS